MTTFELWITVEIGKPFHQEVGIGKGFNNIEVIKSWVFKFGVWVTIEQVKLLLGPFHNFHEVTNKNIFALHNFDQSMNTFKQREDTW
jgi:hypothetical protein